MKITLPTSYLISRLAWSCLYQQKTYRQVTYDGETMWHWCLREVEWGTRWLLKTHVYKGQQRPSRWTKGDKFVVQVWLAVAGAPGLFGVLYDFYVFFRMCVSSWR